MTTYVLTAKEPHPITGLKPEMLGWHFSSATAMDVFDGMRFIQRGGWTWLMMPHPARWADQQLWLYHTTPDKVSANLVPDLKVDNTQWFAFDGLSVRVLENDVAETDYDVTIWTPPPAPAEPTPPEQPEQPEETTP